MKNVLATHCVLDSACGREGARIMLGSFSAELHDLELCWKDQTSHENKPAQSKLSQ